MCGCFCFEIVCGRSLEMFGGGDVPNEFMEPINADVVLGWSDAADGR